ncbi:MAG: molybdopterin-synthase adenylyltransferase MoeB [Gammaproteobacteria bacterium]|nr:molybdopterin-synthase adenylyltransferase MoeB [Gammaproteobacteria bacterium]MCW8986262.1 molybdopterin-synthase adenylyltransferase MoeB [Gammaproteobacteria bacterium]MCW9031331.1 molybdopterin-synthase adenylyltransferase MoeB [Gammaproteobacteria bacterium]
MNDEQLLRYSRQIMLPQIDLAGQEKLLASRVLIIGMGGLGSPAAMYLATAGVGHLVLVDDDKVELSNLQRQIAHGTPDINLAKVESAKHTLLNLNPEITVTIYAERLTDRNLANEIKLADVVIDGTDNFSTRFLINNACVKNKTPLVSGAAIRMEGQVSTFNKTAESPCYNCLYKDEGELDTSCSSNGVLSPVVGIIGSIQATEAIKVLLDIGDSLDGRLLMLDALHMELRTLKLKKDPQCPTCN